MAITGSTWHLLEGCHVTPRNSHAHPVIAKPRHFSFHKIVTYRSFSWKIAVSGFYRTAFSWKCVRRIAVRARAVFSKRSGLSCGSYGGKRGNSRVDYWEPWKIQLHFRKINILPSKIRRGRGRRRATLYWAWSGGGGGGGGGRSHGELTRVAERQRWRMEAVTPVGGPASI